MLDTARNYYPVADILRTIEAMGANKLNVFHWHLTDAHSFPIVLPTEPGLAEKEAYGAGMQYTPEDVKTVVEFAMNRGVRVMPEIDAPDPPSQRAAPLKAALSTRRTSQSAAAPLNAPPPLSKRRRTSQSAAPPPLSTRRRTCQSAAAPLNAPREKLLSTPLSPTLSSRDGLASLNAPREALSSRKNPAPSQRRLSPPLSTPIVAAPVNAPVAALSSRGSTQASKNTRGRTKLLKLFKRTKPVKVKFNEYGQPIGKSASTLSNFCGLIARNGQITPLSHKDWRLVPNTDKNFMWNIIQRKFKIPEGGKRWVMLSIGKKWREFKCMLKKLHYDPHITYEERIADRDSRVIPNEWEFLVNYWNSESALDRSAKNKATRAKQDITHTAGTKSFARVRAEMTKETKIVPKRPELYIRTHTKKNGEALESCKSNIVAIKNLSSHNTEIAQKNASRDDLLVMALGEEKRQNYVRCYGLGATPSEVFGSNPTRVECLRMLSETQKIAEEEKHAMQKEMVEMRQEMSLMRARLETMEKRSQDVNILEDRDIPSNPIGTSNPINGTNSIPSEGLPSNEIQSSESSFEVPQNKIYRAKVVAKNVHTTLDNGGGLEVYLRSLKKPHKYVAQGSLLSTNPTTKVGDVELGSQCWEVQINVPIEPNEPLLRSYGGFQNIGDAVGATVAWPFTFVQRK